MSPGLTGPLDFSDWLSRRGNTNAHGWLVVGEVWKTPDAHLSTFSYLVSTDTLVQRLNGQRTGVDSGGVEREIIEAFLKSRAYAADTDEEEDEGDEPVGPDKRPFVIESYFHGYRPFDVTLVDAFQLFWNAFWDGEVLRRIDVDGVVHDVAKKTRVGDSVRLEVDLHHLKSFLALANAGLMRIHDHMRYTAGQLAQPLQGTHVDATGNFEYHAAENELALTDYRSFGRVMGKDIVEPYREMSGDPREPQRGYERFIVGRRENGSEYEASADEDLQEAPFLTPVYFGSEVLRKYYDAPDRYAIETGLVRCLALWSIPIDRRTDDLIQGWLGDLGRIPHVEQRHWRAFNVSPPGTGISEERFKRDFEAQWINPKDDLAFDFKRSQRRLEQLSTAVLGRPIYRPPSNADQYLLDGIRVPVSDGPEESDGQIIALAKLTVDAFDNDLLRDQIEPGTDVKGLRSIALLTKALETWGIADADAIAARYHELWMVRSTGAAHRRGSTWEKTLSQAGLLELSNKDLAAELLRRITKAQEHLIEALELRNVGKSDG